MAVNQSGDVYSALWVEAVLLIIQSSSRMVRSLTRWRVSAKWFLDKEPSVSEVESSQSNSLERRPRRWLSYARAGMTRMIMEARPLFWSVWILRQVSRLDVHLEGRFLTMLIEQKGDRTYLIDTRRSSVLVRVDHLLMLEDGRLVSVWSICVSERSISAGAKS